MANCLVSNTCGLSGARLGEFLDHCSEFDGSEHPADGNRAPVSPLIQSLAPLFKHELTFQGAVSALDGYARAKREISGSEEPSPGAVHMPALGTSQRLTQTPSMQGPARIAMFTTATKNSKCSVKACRVWNEVFTYRVCGART